MAKSLLEKVYDNIGGTVHSEVNRPGKEIKSAYLSFAIPYGDKNNCLVLEVEETEDGVFLPAVYKAKWKNEFELIDGETKRLDKE